MSILLAYAAFGAILGLIVFVCCLVGVYLTSKIASKERLQLNYWNPVSKKNEPFTSIMDPETVEMSIIIPAYNESKRLPVFLDVLFPYLAKVDYDYEIIVVDDGSKDETVDVVHSYAEKYGPDIIRCMKLPVNRGKGGAVRQGVLSCRGREVLFADADGATDINDLGKVRAALADLVASRRDGTAHGIGVGSRAHLQDDAVVKRSFFRNLLMWGFHMFVLFVGGINNIKDTQCGFKLFTRNSARAIFTNLNIERWAFDVEIFVIANYLGIGAVEVPVNWEEVDGSKIVPIWSWVEMAKDLLMIRTRYLIGAWSVDKQKME